MLYGEPTCIFATARNWVLVPIMVRNIKDEYRIDWFFWNSDEKTVYAWKFFRTEIYHDSFHYASEIIKDLSTVCYWNEDAYLISSCTLDDEHFWMNYVLAKQDGRYKYLEAFQPGC